MAGTYSQILLHIVFSTRHRNPWITPDIAARPYPYIGGIIRAEKGVLFDIGGVEDHVHMYFRRRPDAAVSDLMRTVKSRSSKWVHDTFPELGSFAWQEGYSAFSVSKSQEESVKKYIAGQAEHHRKESFKSELLRFLRATGSSSTRSTCSSDSSASRKFLCPSGASHMLEPFHGLRSGSPVGDPALHPWLQPMAPLGPKRPNHQRPLQSGFPTARGADFVRGWLHPRGPAGAKAPEPPASASERLPNRSWGGFRAGNGRQWS